MRKWLLSIFTFILMAVGCCAITSCEKATDVQGLIYEKIEGKEEYRVVNTYMEAVFTHITIPETYLGLPVTEIGALHDYGYLKSIRIPSSIKKISNDWAYSTSLESIYIEDIGAWCSIEFDGYSSSNPLSVGADLYLNNKLVTDLVIPDSVTTIGKYAFYNCSNLTSVVIPDSVTTIGICAFSSCSSLTSVYITDIAAWCNISFGGVDANPLYCAKNLYLNNELITDLIIPEGVTEIKSCAFSSCDSLTSVVIGDSVTSIGYDAFRYCSSLTSVVIGESVTAIGNYAFDSCSSLTSVVIPDSVTTIGDEAFWGCWSLTTVYYKGTASDWSSMSIYSKNYKLTDATRYYYDESETVANWWHYDENGETVHA